MKVLFSDAHFDSALFLNVPLLWSLSAWKILISFRTTIFDPMPITIKNDIFEK